MHILAPVHLAVECTFDLVVLAAVPCNSGLICSSQTAAGTCGPAPAAGTNGGACNLAATPAGKLTTLSN